MGNYIEQIHSEIFTVSHDLLKDKGQKYNLLYCFKSTLHIAVILKTIGLRELTLLVSI